MSHPTRATLRGLLAGLCLATATPGLAAPAWVEGPALAHPRREVAVAAIGRNIYVAGGTTEAEQAMTLFERFDTRSRRWTQLAPLPVAASHLALVALGGRLYAFGGFARTVHAEPLDAAQVYDPASDRWTILPAMPKALGSLNAVSDGRMIHLLGGRGADKKTVADHLLFDPGSRLYTPRAPLPAGQDHMAAVLLAEKVHVIGGRLDGVLQNRADHIVYDPRGDRWTMAAPLPAPRSGGAAVVLGRRIIYAGGECTAAIPAQGQTYAESWAYDAASGWTALPPLPAGRHGFQAGAVGRTAWFVGGSLSCGGGKSPERMLALRP